MSKHAVGLFLVLVLFSAAPAPVQSGSSSSPPPPPPSGILIVDFKSTQQPGDVYVLTGYVTGVNPADVRYVHLSGIIGDYYVGVAADGSFQLTLDMPPDGTVAAQAWTYGGQSSNVATTIIW